MAYPVINKVSYTNHSTKPATKLLVPVLIFTSIALSTFFLQQKLSPYTGTNVSKGMYHTHILGGFGINTPEKASEAATEGIQVVFRYATPPAENDILGQKLKSLHMGIMDGYISSDLFAYECHRTRTVKPPPAGQRQFCLKANDDPYWANEDVLLAAIAAHLQQVKDNQLVVGYWVLDDWASWDAGSARQILMKIHDLIRQYTPGRPAICGFGGFLSSDQTAGWSDWIADNFSPQGCDEVGFYIYAPSLPNTIPIQPADDYDWSMSATLPMMLASLQQRGWDITQEPLIGIGQAFGGPIAHTNRYWVTPNAEDIETQSKSFCEHGATGLTFYGWDDSEFSATTSTPMNSPEIETGIRNGIRACKQYWNNHS